MEKVYEIAILYGQRLEALLEGLGARGPAKGAGDLLDQVKHLIDPEGLRKVRRFLKLRNRVVHGRPVHMPMPTQQELLQVGQEAVAVLEEVGNRAGMGLTAPGPVYRIGEQDGRYEIWVGPGGVWVVAEGREVLKQAWSDTKARLSPRFPRLAVRGALRIRRETLEARVRYGKRRLSPEEVQEAVRLLREPVQRSVDQAKAVHPKAPVDHRMRKVTVEGLPVTFYVGPVGVLVVSESPLIAETEAKRVLEDSKGAISALPVVLRPELKEAQGRVKDILALRDEEAIKDYLRGKRLLDNKEVDLVAGWLQNRIMPPPSIRPKEGRPSRRGEGVTEGRTKAPPVLVVELVPPGPPPKPSPMAVMARKLSWRVVFIPELLLFLVAALAVSPWWWIAVALLLWRFWALFGEDDPEMKSAVLLLVGVLELIPVWLGQTGRFLKDEPFFLLILVPGVLSLLRAAWLYFSLRYIFLSVRNTFAPYLLRSRVR